MEESLGGETEGTDRDNRIIGEGLGIGETEEIEERGTRGAREAIGEEEVVLEGEIGRVLIITETAIIRIDLFKQ